MHIRQATIEDLETLIEMGKHLHESEQMFEPLLTFSSKDATKHYEDELKNPLALLLIVEDSGIAIAYLYAHAEPVLYFSTDKLECEIEVIYVASKYRGQGLAQQLVRECVSWAKGKNIFRFKTGIYAENNSSKSAFMKSGFVPYHTTYTLINED